MEKGEPSSQFSDLPNQVDDLYFSTLLYGEAASDDNDDDNDNLVAVSDEKFAIKLQLQEVIASSLISLKKRENTGEGSQVASIDIKRKKPEDMKSCTICMELVAFSDYHNINGCSHSYCRSCISRYVAAKLSENAASVKCPDPTCTTGSLDPVSCRSILPTELLDRWFIVLREAEIACMEKVYCPYKDCSMPLLADGKETVAESECPHCHRMFCSQCMAPWHTGILCSAYQNLREDKREDLMLLKLAESCNWQRCPKCRFFVERIDGCMYMTCRCGHAFCYGCASPIKDHYCAKCRR